MAISVRYLNKATNETYRENVIGSYLGDKQRAKINDAAAATGISAGAIAGIEATQTDAQSDVIDAGAGDDHVLASWGDDRVQGGTGADELAGLAGNDILEGGDDDDLDGDGTVEAGDLSSVERARHGSDFLDVGAGNDKIMGDGNADQLFGGIGNDRLYGDTGVPSSDAGFLAAQYHGADYLDGEDGDDTLYAREGKVSAPGHANLIAGRSKRLHSAGWGAMP